MPRQVKVIPFGKYELLEKIAVGGMAEIFKARTQGVGGFEKYLAIKRILPHLSENKEFIDMLINEAKIAVRLSHANIVQIYDLGKIDDSYFIAMEYIEGKDLRAVMHRCEEIGMPLFVQHAVFVTIEVCKGLEYAHAKSDTDTSAGGPTELNIVHRDISPQNVMISYEGEVKITDFGIAKASVNVNHTEAGVVKGKYEYMSPEQASGLPVDRRTDIFSTGIVLYEMLTGVRPFRGDSDLTILERVREAKVEPPSKYNKSVPRKLEKIVLKALSKEPEDRFQNATELKDDLTKFFYSSTFNFTTSNLASYMKSIYSEEIRLDVTIDVDGVGVKPKSNADSLAGDPESTRTGASESLGGSDLIDIEKEVNRILVPGTDSTRTEASADPLESKTETSLSVGEELGGDDEHWDADSNDRTRENDIEIPPEFDFEGPETELRPERGAVDLTDAGQSNGNGTDVTSATRPNMSFDEDGLDQTTATRPGIDPLDATSDTLASISGAGTGSATISGGTAERSTGPGTVPQREATVITAKPNTAPAESVAPPPSVAPASPPTGQSSSDVKRGPKLSFKPRVVKEKVRGRTVNATNMDEALGVGVPKDDDRPTQPPRQSAPAAAKPKERTVIGVRPSGAPSEPSTAATPTEETAADPDPVTQDVEAVHGRRRAGNKAPNPVGGRTGSSSVTLGVKAPATAKKGGTTISPNPLDQDTGSDTFGAAVREAPSPAATSVGAASDAGFGSPSIHHDRTAASDEVFPVQHPQSIAPAPGPGAVVGTGSARLHPMVLLACVSGGFLIGAFVMWVAYFLR